MKKVFIAVLLLAVGCGWPIRSEDMPAVINSLAGDDASGCFWLGGRGGGGGGAVTPTPATVPMTGAYGSGEVLFGRVNSDNTELEINNGTCKIRRGLPGQAGSGSVPTSPFLTLP